MFPFLAQIPAQLTPRQAVEAIPDAAQVLQRRVVELAPAALVALLLLFFFWGMARGVSRLLGRAFDRAHVDPALRGLTLRLTRFFILMLGVLVAARQMGLEVGSLVAGLGIVGLAIGMAAQDLLANLIAGFTILWDRPFRVGDVVTIGSTTGSVAEIGLRTTRLWVADQKLVILPNREAIAGTVVNHTVGGARRLFVRLGIAFEQPLEPVRNALLAVAARQPGLLQDPPAEVVLFGFGESALEIELRAHLKDAQDEGPVKFRLLEEIKLAFEQASIEFPYPQRTMRIKGSLTAGASDS